VYGIRCASDCLAEVLPPRLDPKALLGLSHGHDLFLATVLQLGEQLHPNGVGALLSAFIHQRLDVKPPLGIKNAPEVRKVLEESGKVLAVLQGHDHKGGYQEIAGVHYCTLRAMVEGSGLENNAYAIMEIQPDDAIRIRGFRKQESYGPL
jgi:hypothetical protein